jgi:hypothetical protein
MKRQPLEIKLPNGLIFITFDKNMVGGVLTKTDENILNPPMDVGSGLYKEIADSELKSLADSANKLLDYIDKQVGPRMNKGRARFVKEIRVDQKYSWRSVALRCFAEWQGNWRPPDNQIVGMKICEYAGELLKEIVD